VSQTLPKLLKESIAEKITQVIAQYGQIGVYRVHRVKRDGANVSVMLKEAAMSGTYMLNISVKEVR
jgi:hypothetical protein